MNTFTISGSVVSLSYAWRSTPMRLPLRPSFWSDATKFGKTAGRPEGLKSRAIGVPGTVTGSSGSVTRDDLEHDDGVFERSRHRPRDVGQQVQRGDAGRLVSPIVERMPASA